MVDKRSILKEIIISKVYKREEILKVSEGRMSWIFDFKSTSMNREFMYLYGELFWHYITDRNVQVGGMESGALALISAVSVTADKSQPDINTFYIRKSRKKSDLANLVEGRIDNDKPIVLVDDILGTGNTFKKQIAIIEDRGLKVSAVFAAIRYRDMDYYKYFTDRNIKVYSIFENNDFKAELGLTNLIDKKKDEVNWTKYKKLWKLSTFNPSLYLVVPKSGPVIDDQNIYMGSDDGAMRSVAKIDGAVNWTYTIPFGVSGKKIFSTPVITDKSLYFGAYDGNFYCLDKSNGEVRWINFDADWIGSSPCLSDDNKYVYVGLEFGLFKKRGGVMCLDAKTGEKIWEYYEMTGLTHASPAFNAKHNIIVCGCNDNYVYALDASSGNLRWKYKTKGEVKYGAIYDNRRNVVIVGSMDGGVYVINLYDGTLYHKFTALFGFYSTAVIYEDLIIIGSLDKNVYAFNLETKSLEWKFETIGRIFASPIVSEGMVYIGSNDGRLYELEVNTGKNISITQFTERIVNRVAIDDTSADDKKSMYVATHDCSLYKIAKS